MQRLKTHLLIIIFLLFYFSITAYKFIAYPTPFYDWDESIYAQVGREMVQQKSIVPLWQGQYWLDKPPFVPLAYGILESVSPLKPELSTRLFTLSLTILLFIFIYYFYYKLTKNVFVSFLTVVISSLTAIFLQRAQVLNVDLFLFLGWMGYLVFFEHFWLSLFFLAIGVLSKSLLGFYPLMLIGGLYVYQYITKSISLAKLFEKIKPLIIQSSVLLLWYVYMFLQFKYPFIQAHFFDSMMKRVTSSIESHFGKRTFYIDLLFDQLKLFAYLSILGIALIFIDFFRKKDVKKTLLLLFFVPWFLFLNLTKTKINWYLYPVIPQFAFLGIYLLVYLKNKKILLLILSLSIAGFVLFKNFSSNSFLGAHYSSYDENYDVALYAKNHCKELNVLVDKDSRTTHDTLQKMNLLIGTSEWWGNHPTLVYYSNQKVNFIYDLSRFKEKILLRRIGSCYVVNNNDLSQIPPLNFPYKKFKDMNLFLEQ